MRLGPVAVVREAAKDWATGPVAASASPADSVEEWELEGDEA